MISFITTDENELAGFNVATMRKKKRKAIVKPGNAVLTENNPPDCEIEFALEIVLCPCLLNRIVSFPYPIYFDLNIIYNAYPTSTSSKK